MKVQKPIATILAVGAMVIVAAAVFLPLRDKVKVLRPAIKGQFTSEEARQIERAVHQDRWRILRDLISTHRFKMAFEICMADVGLGSPQEIGSENSPTISASGSLTNMTGAYLISTGWCQKTVKYEMERTTTGWKIAMVVFPTIKASNKRM